MIKITITIKGKGNDVEIKAKHSGEKPKELISTVNEQFLADWFKIRFDEWLEEVKGLNNQK